MGNKTRDNQKSIKVTSSHWTLCAVSISPLTCRHRFMGCADSNTDACLCSSFFTTSGLGCRHWKCHHIKHNLPRLCEIIGLGVNELMPGISTQMWIPGDWLLFYFSLWPTEVIWMSALLTKTTSAPPQNWELAHGTGQLPNSIPSSSLSPHSPPSS